MVENPEIIIHNSSFGSLDLLPGTKAQITDCYIDAQFKPRPTLITANNSDVSIQNCHFGNFINENGSTVLYGHDNSNITINNSVFIQHNSSKGILFLLNNSSMRISDSSISQNVASSPGYSAISIQDGIHADVHDTVFRNNSALVGGALIAQEECRVTLTNCNFSSNKAIIGKTPQIFNNSKVDLRRAPHTLDQNTMRLYVPISPTLFNQTSLGDKKRKVIAPRLLVKSSILKKISVQKEDGLLEPDPGQGGTIYVATQSQLLVTNCTFEDNSAQSWGGAIVTVFNATLRVQETTFVGNKAPDAGAIFAALNTTLHIGETTFVGNKASDDGGAINIQEHSYLRMKHCLFDNNMSQRSGGAICGGFNATLNIHQTNFTCNRAEQGGAIEIDRQSYLHSTDCTIKDNHAEEIGGAIAGGLQAVLEINGSYFSNNSALQGGAIDVQHQANLSLTNCRLEGNFASEFGGAIAAWTTGSAILRIRETNFTGNSAHDGGALVVDILLDCHVVSAVFNGNTAKDSGGAVHVRSKSSVQVEKTNFTNNNATDGGAIYIQGNSKLQTNMCSFWKNFARTAGGAIMLEGYSTAVIESCHFQSNHAVRGGAVGVNQPEHLSVLSTSLLRNVASDGGAIAIGNGADVIINNITCVGNHGLDGGGCLNVDSVTLTLNNSDISENFGHDYGAGVTAVHSEIQVCAKLTNETIFMLLNANFQSNYHKCYSLFLLGIHIFSNSKSLAQLHALSFTLREFVWSSMYGTCHPFAKI